MTGNTSKAVLLSIHELLLLLYKREIEGMVFPDEIAEASANEFQLKSGMGELITDGYLVPGDDATYHISPEMDPSRRRIQLLHSVFHLPYPV